MHHTNTECDHGYEKLVSRSFTNYMILPSHRTNGSMSESVMKYTSGLHTSVLGIKCFHFAYISLCLIYFLFSIDHLCGAVCIVKLYNITLITLHIN